MAVEMGSYIFYCQLMRLKDPLKSHHARCTFLLQVCFKKLISATFIIWIYACFLVPCSALILCHHLLSRSTIDQMSAFGLVKFFHQYMCKVFHLSIQSFTTSLILLKKSFRILRISFLWSPGLSSYVPAIIFIVLQ